MLLARCPSTLALNPALDISQYAHTAWKVRDGFTRGAVYSIAQTPDGYLWLGTEFGLVRFDGVRAIPWEPPPNQPLPSSHIWRLLVSRDGTLWIATLRGLVSWKDGRLIRYPELTERSVVSLVEDHRGAVWAGSQQGDLCSIHERRVECQLTGTPGRAVYGLYEDRAGTLWAGVTDGLLRWKAGSSEFRSLPGEDDHLRSFIDADDGTLLFGTRSGLQRLADGTTYPYALPGGASQFGVRKLLRDRESSLWIATDRQGLVHVHEGRTDIFSQRDGLSGDGPTSLFEDGEGNVWVTTIDGLDRFSDVAVATFSVSQGLSSSKVGSVLALRDRSVWLGTFAGLNRWVHGQIGVAPTGNGDGKLNGRIANSVFQDHRGRIWASTQTGVGYLDGGLFTAIGGVPGGAVHAMAEDTQGDVWIAHQDRGLFRVSPGNAVQEIPWTRFGGTGNAAALIAGPDGLWIGFYRGGIVRFSDDRVGASYTAADGLGTGRVSGFLLDGGGTLWIATEGGLSRLKNGHIATLTSRNGLPCDAVHWAIEDDAHAIWSFMPCGLVRIARTELDAWARAVDSNNNPQLRIHPAVFDNADGVRVLSIPSGYSPPVAKSSDGKLWFVVSDGVSVVDPRHLAFNSLPPPVHIEQVTVDGATHDFTSDLKPRLPALTRELQVDYTALSFVAPGKNRFQYKLEGYDRDWQYAGSRRQAFYTNLPPGPYRFRVKASNNSGVWNEAGASLDFSIAPAYYQRTWFRALVVILALTLLWSAHRYRLRRIAYEFNARLDERVAERTRIARELHDTLLQSFHAVLFRFQAANNMLPDRPVDAKQTLDTAIDQAASAITEGRDAVHNLRSAETADANDLAVAIATLSKELLVMDTDHA